MNIYSKKGMLFFVSVDHLTGEDLGQIMDYFYAAGASSVQVIPTLTKKNRPAHLIYIDCAPECADSIENIIATELGCGGWHQLETDHRHLGCEIRKRAVSVSNGDKNFEFVLEVKIIGGNLMSARPEHRNRVGLKDRVLTEFGKRISLETAGFKILEAFHNKEKTTITFITTSP